MKLDEPQRAKKFEDLNLILPCELDEAQKAKIGDFKLGTQLHFICFPLI